MSNRLLQLLERVLQHLQKPPPRILDWLAESMMDLRALKRRAVTFAIDRKSHLFATRLSLKLASDIMEIWFPDFGCRRLSFTATAQASLPFPLTLWMDGTFLPTCLANFMVHSCSVFAAKNVRRDPPNSAVGWQQQKKGERANPMGAAFKPRIHNGKARAWQTKQTSCSHCAGDANVLLNSGVHTSDKETENCFAIPDRILPISDACITPPIQC